MASDWTPRRSGSWSLKQFISFSSVKWLVYGFHYTSLVFCFTSWNLFLFLLWYNSRVKSSLFSLNIEIQIIILSIHCKAEIIHFQSYSIKKKCLWQAVVLCMNFSAAIGCKGPSYGTKTRYILKCWFLYLSTLIKSPLHLAEHHPPMENGEKKRWWF